MNEKYYKHLQEHLEYMLEMVKQKDDESILDCYTNLDIYINVETIDDEDDLLNGLIKTSLNQDWDKDNETSSN